MITAFSERLRGAKTKTVYLLKKKNWKLGDEKCGRLAACLVGKE